MAKNVTLAVKSITCIDDSTEVGAEEPYILVTAVDLAPTVPQVEVTRYGPWSDVDKGETHGTLVIPPGTPPPVVDVLSTLNVVRRPFWGIDNKTPAPIVAGKTFFFVSLVENDEGDPEALRTIVKGAAVGSLAASFGLPTSTRISKLESDIEGALNIPTGAPNFDDVVGTRQLMVSPAEVNGAAPARQVKVIRFTTANDGVYDVAVELATP